MKKRIILMAISLGLILVFLWSCEHDISQEMKFPIGKDTKYAFGDGTIQIYSQGKGKYVLLDNQNQKTLMMNVRSYKVTETHGYILGDGRFVVVDISNNHYDVYTSSEQIPTEYRTIYGDLQNQEMP